MNNVELRVTNYEWGIFTSLDNHTSTFDTLMVYVYCFVKVFTHSIKN